MRLRRNQGPAAARSHGVDRRAPPHPRSSTRTTWRPNAGARHAGFAIRQESSRRSLITTSSTRKFGDHRRARKPGPSGLWITPLVSAAIVRRSSVAEAEARSGLSAALRRSRSVHPARLAPWSGRFPPGRSIAGSLPGPRRSTDLDAVPDDPCRRDARIRNRLPHAAGRSSKRCSIARIWSTSTAAGVAPMLASSDRRPPPDFDRHIGYGYSVFEFAMFDLLKNGVSPAILGRRGAQRILRGSKS